MNQTYILRNLLAAVLFLYSALAPAWSQSSLPIDKRTNGKEVRAAFAMQRAAIQKCTAVIYDGWRFFNYGIVVSKDGYLIAKASELINREDLSVRIGATKYSDVKVVATNARWDVALIKVVAEDLSPADWAESSDLEQGSWVVANGASSRSLRRVNVGIISAKGRELIGRAPAVMGVSFIADDTVLEIDSVTQNSGAEAAGLRKGDIIKKFGGDEITTREALIERIRDFMAGELVAVEFEREGEIIKQDVKLMKRDAVSKEKKSRNDSMSGDYSERRDSFPRVLQTDIPFSARTIGGPLLNLQGKCIGMNIARANRAESFAIPVEDIKTLITKLMKAVK